MTKAIAESLVLLFLPFRKNRPDLLKVLRELLLEPLRVTEQEVSREPFDGKTEKTLKQMAFQLQGELGRFIQANSLSQPRRELELSKVELKDASVQTVATEGGRRRLGHGGDKRQAWEEKPTGTALGTEPRPENMRRAPWRQATRLSFPGATDKVSFSTYFQHYRNRKLRITSAPTAFFLIYIKSCLPLPALILAST